MVGVAGLLSHLKAVGERIIAADVPDRAGALTYWGFLSLFPALIIAVAVLGIVGQLGSAQQEIVNALRDAAPGPAVEMVDQALEDAVEDRGGIGGILGVGLLLTFYTASSATGAAVRGVEAIYGRRHGGEWWHGFAIRFALTIALGTMVFVAFVAILLAGPVFSRVSEVFGLSESVSTMVSIIRWPIGVMAITAVALLLYWVGSGRQRRIGALLPGAASAVVVILIATFGFDFYVSNFENYGATYGSLGAVIVLLVWMWLSSLGLLSGAAVNAEIEAQRLDAGGPTGGDAPDDRASS